MQRINWFPNPDFNPNGTQPTGNKTATGAMSDGVLSVIATSTLMDSYVYFDVPGLPAGLNVVFSIRVTENANGSVNTVQIANNAWKIISTMVIGDGATHVSVPFTVPDDGIVRIQLFPHRHDGTSDTSASRSYTHPQLELASTYTGNEQGGGSFSAAARCRSHSHPIGGDRA